MKEASRAILIVAALFFFSSISEAQQYGPSGGQMEFSGQVNGKSIEGTVKVNGQDQKWSAALKKTPRISRITQIESQLIYIP